jgi:hypothetical protein
MIKRLATDPSSHVTSWQGCDINVYLFYTAAKDKKTVSQNSGVSIEALDERTDQSTTYYGDGSSDPGSPACSLLVDQSKAASGTDTLPY